MGVAYGGGVGTSGGPQRSTSHGSGALGGLGTVGSITVNTAKAQFLKFLASMKAMKQSAPPVPTAPKQSGAYNTLSTAGNLFSKFNRDRLQGKNVRRASRMQNQRIDNAQERLNINKTLYVENQASRGIVGKTRGGQADVDWRFSPQQKNINVAKEQRHETKSSWRRSRWHNAIFG